MKDEKQDITEESKATKTMKTKNTKSFSHEELNKKLHDAQDLFERLSGCPFFPLKDTAKGIRGSKEHMQQMGEIREGLEGDGIYVGVKASEMTDHRESMLETLSNFLGYEIEVTPDGYTLTYKNGTPPIYITVITRNYKFFKNPDITFWGVTEFLMPNPFDDYWKARGIVK